MMAGQIITKGYQESGPVGFDIIDLSSFTVQHSGFFHLPSPSDTLAQDLGCPYPYNGKLYFPYSLYKPAEYEFLDTSYVAIYDASTFALEKVIKEPRVQGLGSNEDIKPYVLGNYIYFLSQKKSIPDMSHKVLRINTTTNEFDDYEFVLDGHKDLFFYNLHDIGGGRALLLSYDANITTDFIYEYWLIDVVNQTFEKLDIPAASDLYYRYFLDIPGDKVAIAVNSETGNYIYTYDKPTGSITKGLEYSGGKIHELSGPLTR